MDWEFLTGAPMLQSQLLHGCFLEAERAERVAQGLDGLRVVLSESYHGHMVALTEEIRKSAKLLRDLAGRSHVHHSRAPIVINHLNVLLPCLSKSLRDITARYDDKTISRELRWRKMYHDMVKESGGLGPPQRFMMYNDFLVQLLFLLVHDKNFDPGQLEALRAGILDLRERRGLPAPLQPPTITSPGPVAVAPDQPIRPGPGPRHEGQNTVVLVPLPRERAHWCEQVFSLPLSSRTDMGLPDRSRALGPFVPQWEQMGVVARRTLVRRSFDKGRLCVTFLENRAADGAPWIVVRVLGPAGAGQSFSCRGHHELCVRRDGNTLVLMRWSRSARCVRDWLVLGFVTWEELILFYCTFIALKARHPLTVGVDPMEFKLKGEDRLFQAQIIDDDYKHSLLVYRDVRTGGIRLQAAVWSGELRRCPVWTAFVTHISASPTWLVPVSKHVVLVKDIQLYVFCQKYREANARRNKSGAFEIYFVSEQAADEFREVFLPPVAAEGPPAIEEPGQECIAGPSSYSQ